MTTSRFDATVAAGAAGLLASLDHVGIAVPDMDAAVARHRLLFGANAVSEPFAMEAQGVRVCFVSVPASPAIELVAPLGDASPLARFLERHPAGGQHHLCFAVPDLAAARAAFAANSVRALGEPRPGAHGAPVLFLHPSDTGGTLLELVERPA